MPKSLISSDVDFQFVPKERVEKLLGDLKSTSKSRFQAARRLEKVDRLSQWTINLISLELILIPTLTLSGAIKSNPYITSYSVFAPVFILFFSVSQSAEKYSLRAHQMHECGMRVNKLRRQIASSDVSMITSTFFKECLDAYDDVLRDYPNHDTVDYLSSEYELNFKGKGFTRYFTLDYFRLSHARLMTYLGFYLTLAIFLIIPPLAYILYLYGWRIHGGQNP